MVEKKPETSEALYLQRLSFEDGKMQYYLKQDIMNADSQMQSLLGKGVGVEYGHFSDRKSLKSLFRAGFRLRRLCQEQRFDVVHVFWGTTTSLMTTIFSPRPVVVSFCGSDLLGNVDANGKILWSGRFSRLLSQLSGWLAARIIVKSNHMKSQLWTSSQRKTTVIPNGVDLTAFQPFDRQTARKRIGWESDQKIIIFFSGLDAVVKDLPLACLTFEEIQRQMPGVEFKVLNKIPHEELVYYYNAADLMLLTSFHEGSNNSLKEARACNLPIVSLYVGDAKERLEGVENSYVLNTRDPAEIAAHAMKVISSGKRSNGAAFSEDVNINRIAEKVIAVYQSIQP